MARLPVSLQSLVIQCMALLLAALLHPLLHIPFPYQPALWQQAHAQMRSGSHFISLSIAVDTRQPDHVLTLAEGARHTLYAWRM